MYLPGELIPDKNPLYLVVHQTRATGATYIDVIADNEEHARRMAEINESCVLVVQRVIDYRKPRVAE